MTAQSFFLKEFENFKRPRFVGMYHEERKKEIINFSGKIYIVRSKYTRNDLNPEWIDNEILRSSTVYPDRGC